MSLRFGVQIFPYHKPYIDPTTQFEDDLRLIEHLDRLGYDEVWIGEHHSTGWQNIGAPELMIAAAAQRTTNITFGTGVSSLPYHHPFILADRIVQLSHLVKGRFIWGVGAGSLAQDAHIIGVDPLEQRRMTDESLEAILALLSYDGPVTRKTDWFEINDAQLHLRPYNGEFDIRVASQLSPSGPRLAGKHGVGIYQFGVMGTEQENPIAQTWAIAEEVAAKHGKTGRPQPLDGAAHDAHRRDRGAGPRGGALGAAELGALHARHPAARPDGPRRLRRTRRRVQPEHLRDRHPRDGAQAHREDPRALRRGRIVRRRQHGDRRPAGAAHSYELLAREVFPYFTGQVGPRLAGVESMAKFGKSGERLAAAHEKARQEYAAEQAAHRAAQR